MGKGKGQRCVGSRHPSHLGRLCSFCGVAFVLGDTCDGIALHSGWLWGHRDCWCRVVANYLDLLETEPADHAV
jgi:hypothetical protein